MKKALVLAIALVMGLGIAAFAASPLSGSWTSSITLSPITPTLTVSTFTSTLVVDYTVGGWTFESTTGFALTGWKTQKFTANGALGAFTLGSTLVFDPTGPSFTKWDSTGKVSIAGVDLSSEFLLGPTGSGWTFGASGVAGDLTLGATAYFNMNSSGGLVQTTSYCFCFSSVDFTASFPFACIDTVSATLSFDHTGFAGVTFSTKGVTIPNISWLTFDASVTFDTTSKSVTITPNINLGTFACITPYYSLDTSGTYHIDGIYIYGLKLSYTWNGVTFTDKTSFDPAKNSSITGKSAYWELFQIESKSDSCCGGAVDFTVGNYFKTGGTTLFDWGETDVSLSFGIGSNFTLNTGLIVDSTGLTQVSGGFTVTW